MTRFSSLESRHCDEYDHTVKFADNVVTILIIVVEEMDHGITTGQKLCALERHDLKLAQVELRD